ncbi:MAG TPA: biotin/lipoyl-binding protein [Fimbriiglobus sp.]|jgi:multidrug resistance efflux pump|nr:biotin/lipoyl-binding protein [Fimbriiglobus sp.]
MLELIIGTYGVLCWLLFAKFKLIPVTTYTIVTAVLGGVVILGLLYVMLSVFHPVSHDGRMYAPVVQVVPQVRGTVTEVPAEGNKPLKAGDVLFRIDPKPYQIEVDRLRASLAAKNVKFAQLSELMAAAEATTKEARANLLVAESQFDRQARETHEQALAQVDQVQKRLDLANANLARLERTKGAVSALELDQTRTRVVSLQEEHRQAVAAEKVALERLKSGSSSLEAVRQDIARLEAEERKLQLQLKAETDGVNPEIREIMAQLDKARWDLDQTVIRAPTDGYVPQQLLRPGMMAVPFPVKPLMVYVVGESPTLVASYPQKVISDLKPGMEGEAVFKMYPGRSFKVKVRRVLTALREGELDAGGQILAATPETAHGYVPVVFDYEEDVAGLNLPVGAQASIAVYTDRVHALSILRKIILRIKSWENFVF